MRQTAQRSAILAFLRAKRHHYTAVQIYDAVRQSIPNISLGTVYRNLGQLIESGDVLTVEAVDKCVYYDGYNKDHAHFVCQTCKEIYDFPIADGGREAVQSEGFAVNTQRVIYYGECAECLKNKQK